VLSELGLKRPLWQVDRLKGKHIFQKDGCRSVTSTQSLEQHPTFCGQDFLDIQDDVSYASPNKKQVLIKKNQKAMCKIKV
jgi:hypothetical protein